MGTNAAESTSLPPAALAVGTLSASDIDERKFPVVRRGYDMSEVDDFLDRVAAKVNRTDREIDQLRLIQQELENQLIDARSSIERLQQELTEAHEETAEAQRHTETTRQMFDHDLRRKTAQVRELETALASAQDEHDAQIAAVRDQLNEAESRATHAEQEAARLQEERESAAKAHQSALASAHEEATEARRQRDEAASKVIALEEGRHELEAASEALGQQVKGLRSVAHRVRELLLAQRDASDQRVTAIDDQIASLTDGPLGRYLDDE